MIARAFAKQCSALPSQSMLLTSSGESKGHAGQQTALGCLESGRTVRLLCVWDVTFFQAYPQFLFRSTPLVVFLRHMSPPSTAFRP